jgi:hypothetical protein
VTSPPQPMRDRSRDNSTVRGAPTCSVCERPLVSSRARYCSAACRQRSFRLRHVQLAPVDDRQLRAELYRRRTLVAHTVYECSVCGERLVGQRRCPQDNVFCRALGLGGNCAECDEPILLADLLELEVTPSSTNPQPSTEKGFPPGTPFLKRRLRRLLPLPPHSPSSDRSGHSS